MDNGTSPNAKRLLWAGFFSIFAAGVGFSVRGGILVEWAKEYGFTMTELGGITGGGLTGFGVIILLGSLIADRVGYGKLMVFAFVMHVLSAGLQMATGPIYAQFGPTVTYWSLYVAMFMFAIGNGTGEVVVNPMVATLFPRQKTHYLNILHAGWPGGLIAGGLVSYFMNGGTIEVGGFHLQPFPDKVSWLTQMSMFLVPTFLYGLLLVGQHLPTSEANEAGLSFGTMLLQFLSPILILLLIIHALVGYVELGTDSWISKITGSIMNDPGRGMLLFVYTSALMFTLRFFAGPIERVISPLGLLFVSGLLGAAGLYMLSGADGRLLFEGSMAVTMCVVSATIYAMGKTFLWPTMLAIVSERFPKGGALTIGAIGGAGMLSAGLLGTPGIGFKQDYFASAQLKEQSVATYERYKAESPSTFLGVTAQGLDGAKVGVLMDNGQELARAVKLIEKKDKKDKADEEQLKLAKWWESAKAYVDEDKPVVSAADLHGGRKALELTALVPLTMAGLYLVLIIYFKLIGGYKAVEIHSA